MLTPCRDLARKVSSTVKSAVEAVKPSKEDRAVRQREQEREERQRRQLYRGKAAPSTPARLLEMCEVKVFLQQSAHS